MGKLKEKKNDFTDKQMLSAMSYCVMLVLFGVPLWWKTTEVYRVALPYAEINALNEMTLKIQMNIHVVTIDKIKGLTLIKDLEDVFKPSRIFNITFKHHNIDKALLGSLKTLQEIEKNIKHPHFEGSLQLFEVPGLSRFTSKYIVSGRNRTIYFSSGTDGIQLYNFLTRKILNEDSLINALNEMSLPEKTKISISNSRHKIPMSTDLDILFSILNPDPESLNVIFNIRETIEGYVNPFIKEMKEIYEFHVKSQWLYFVGLEAQPKFINHTDRGPHFALASELLPHVITPLEKKLASHASKYPCLNFVLYITPCSNSPMLIYTKNGYPVDGANAFISPKWGGVQIYNPERNTCSNDGSIANVVVHQHYIMSVFLQQLKLILGIPDVKENEEFSVESNLRLWERDSLLRLKTVKHLSSAKLTLQSLAELLGKISNIVINDRVGDSIKMAVESFYKSLESLDKGHLLKGHVNSKIAFLESENAFTDPSLLALLYFPDDQKYAVYIPLFLPVMIPVVISFKHIAQWASAKLRSHKKIKEE